MSDLRFLEYLKCPDCGGAFRAGSAEDRVTCEHGHAFPYTGNVIDLSSASSADPLQKRSNRSFQLEWTEYYPSLGWRPDELAAEAEMFLSYTRAMPNFFSDRVIVDAGCGNGRYIKIVNSIASPPPRLIIAVDASDSVFIAARNCSTFTNTLFLKLDLNLLPSVLARPVDYVYSIGVLHHTPDAHASFRNLARCLNPGGFLSAFIYGKGNPILFRVNTFLRNRFFRNWPPRLVYAVCFAVAVPSQLFRIKFAGPWLLDFVTRFVFVSPDVHNMFDAYTAGFTSFHDKESVERWFRECGMDCVVESQLNHTSLFCIGRTPESRAALPWGSYPSDVMNLVGKA